MLVDDGAGIGQAGWRERLGTTRRMICFIVLDAFDGHDLEFLTLRRKHA
jgi:hypothetical protein